MANNINNKSFNSKIFSSAHINFLLGAGVNGSAFPQLDNFREAIDLLKKEFPNIPDEEFDFEGNLSKLEDVKRNDIFNSFAEEFKKNMKK